MFQSWCGILQADPLVFRSGGKGKHTHTSSVWVLGAKLRSLCVLQAKACTLNYFPSSTLTSSFLQLTEQVSGRVPPLHPGKVAFEFCLFFPVLGGKQVTNQSPNLKGEMQCTNSWRRGSYLNYLEFLCTGDLFLPLCLFIYSSIYLCQHGLVNSYFML